MPDQNAELTQFPGAMTICASSLTTAFSGVTIPIEYFQPPCLPHVPIQAASSHLFGFFHHFLDAAHHVKGLLRKIIVLAFTDFLKSPDGVFDFDIFAAFAR